MFRGCFSECYELSESWQDGIFLRKNPVGGVIPDYVLPENGMVVVNTLEAYGIPAGAEGRLILRAFCTV